MKFHAEKIRDIYDMVYLVYFDDIIFNQIYDHILKLSWDKLEHI